MSLMLLHFVQFEEVKVNLTHADAFKSGCFYCNRSYFTWINCIFCSLRRLCFYTHIWWWVFAFQVLFVSKILYVRIFVLMMMMTMNKSLPSVSKYNDRHMLKITPTKNVRSNLKLRAWKCADFWTIRTVYKMDVDEFFVFFHSLTVRRELQFNSVHTFVKRTKLLIKWSFWYWNPCKKNASKEL